jgi:hypothetical protein
LLVIAAGVWLAGGRAANAEPPAGSQGHAWPSDVESEAFLAWALGQLIYDVPDDSQGVSSALRGHSLARTMYGFNDQVLNAQPFNGTGRLHFTHGLDSGAIAGADDHRLINYQAFDGEPLRDPERYGHRANARQARPFFTAGFNAPYTYADLNNMFLAAARSDGTVITPSFHRDWLFGPLDAANPNWTSPNGKYLTLRPRPAEMGPGFRYPIPYPVVTATSRISSTPLAATTASGSTSDTPYSAPLMAGSSSRCSRSTSRTWTT